MALLIQNVTGGDLDINDLGLTIAPSETLDLTVDASPSDVSSSGANNGDLFNLITSENVVVKDPINISIDLSITDAIVAIRNHNQTHYRMPPGARLPDIQDVNFATTPVSGNVLSFDGEFWIPTNIVTNLNFDDLNNVTAPGNVEGSLLISDGNGNWIENNKLILGSSTTNCVLQTINELGQDWCNWQIGNSGSAFTIAKRSFGTLETPLPLTDGVKIGGFAFIGEDGEPLPTGPAGSPGYVGAELAGITFGTQTATNGGTGIMISVTAENEKSRQSVLGTDSETNIILPNYPNTRNDATPAINFLHTDPTGKLISSPLTQMQQLRPTFVIFGEENGGVSVGANIYEYSFGNGATNNVAIPSGIVIGVACTLIAITVSARNTSNGTSTVSISVVKDGNVVSTGGIASATGGNAEVKNATSVTPDTVNFDVGDTLQFLTASTSGSLDDVRVSAWFERTA